MKGKRDNDILFVVKVKNVWNYESLWKSLSDTHDS